MQVVYCLILQVLFLYYNITNFLKKKTNNFTIFSIFSKKVFKLNNTE